MRASLTKEEIDNLFRREISLVGTYDAFVLFLTFVGLIIFIGWTLICHYWFSSVLAITSWLGFFSYLVWETLRSRRFALEQCLFVAQLWSVPLSVEQLDLLNGYKTADKVYETFVRMLQFRRPEMFSQVPSGSRARHLFIKRLGLNVKLDQPDMLWSREYSETYRASSTL